MAIRQCQILQIENQVLSTHKSHQPSSPVLEDVTNALIGALTDQRIQALLQVNRVLDLALRNVSTSEYNPRILISLMEQMILQIEDSVCLLKP